jgi:hypothetical protein
MHAEVPAKRTEGPAMSYKEFLVYLFDARATRELAVELAVAIDERQYFEQLSALLV